MPTTTVSTAEPDRLTPPSRSAEYYTAADELRFRWVQERHFLELEEEYENAAAWEPDIDREQFINDLTWERVEELEEGEGPDLSELRREELLEHEDSAKAIYAEARTRAVPDEDFDDVVEEVVAEMIEEWVGP